MINEKENPTEHISQIEKQLKHSLQKLERKLEKQEQEFSEASQNVWYQQIADSLLSTPPSIPRGSSNTAILNIHTQKEENISLNPKLDVNGNAELYYKKAKKARRGADISEKKVEATRVELEQIKLYLDECKKIDVTNESQVVQFTEKVGKSLPEAISLQTPSVKGEKIPYRHITIDGWDIYLGKNDTQNDELSTRFAKPSDLWFHVAGHAGSHVIIRRPKNSGLPPKEIIEKVASLSVWFSKAKHTSYAEVNYTEARFVRKRHHAPPGEVIAERCKTIRVSPKSPHELFPSTFMKDEE